MAHNKCWTTDRLAKRGLTQSLLCPLCDQQDETINHILVSCSFVRQFWFDLLRPFGLQDFHLGLDMDDFDLFGVLIVVGYVGFAAKAMILWSFWVHGLWKHRNSVVFHGTPPNLVVAVQLAREEVLLWSLAGAKGISFLQARGPVV